LLCAGSWSKALTLADALHHQAGGSVNFEWLDGTAGALQQLGCQRLIQTYCQGLAPEARQSVSPNLITTLEPHFISTHFRMQQHSMHIQFLAAH